MVLIEWRYSTNDGGVIVSLTVGNAAYATGSLLTGDHHIVAVYSGNNTFDTSTSAPADNTVEDFTVVNSGTITGPSSGTPYSMPAIGLNGGNSAVTNLAGGQITGQRGVYLIGGNNVLDNAGTITGTNDVAVYADGGEIITNQANGTINCEYNCKRPASMAARSCPAMLISAKRRTRLTSLLL